MSWSLHRWVWQLEAPLYVGMPPAGTLNRCRLYVPARAIWAAITADLARNGSNGFPKYAELGEHLREQARFTYLFPAEHLGGRWLAWLPIFERGEGLCWYRDDLILTRKESRSDRAFRSRLLDARPGTAIDATSGTAADGTLRETDCINTHWRTEANGEARPVGLIGYVFRRADDGIVDGISKIDVLSLGGDTRYGLGRMRRVEWADASDVFGAQVSLDANTPSIRSKTVLAHTLPHAGTPEILGALELLAGWDLASNAPDKLAPLHKMPLWMPGSRISADSKATPEWEIVENGYWRYSGSAS